MRTFLLVLLLSGAASPVLAADRDADSRSVFRGHRAERAQPSDDGERREAPRVRPQRRGDAVMERADSGPRAAVVTADPAPSTRMERFERRAAGDAVRGWREDSDGTALEPRTRKAHRQPILPHRPDGERLDRSTRAEDSVRTWRRDERGESGSPRTIEERIVRVAPGVGDAGGLVQSRRPLPRVFEPTERRVSRTPVWGTEPPAPRTAGTPRAQAGTRWSTHWRHDRRYDWRDWRRQHRDRFRFGFYYDPFGWDYFRYGIGWRLWPTYYRSNYWLHDPWQYRLPPAYGPYRWVRYHNDALLVNIYTGQVVDVEYDFFW